MVSLQVKDAIPNRNDRVGSATLDGYVAIGAQEIPNTLEGGVTTEAAFEKIIYIATSRVRVRKISCVFPAANGSALTMQVQRLQGTEAIGSGDDLLATPFDLNATANTVQNKDETSGLTTTVANTILEIGDRLCVDLNTNPTATLTSATVTALISPVNNI